MKRIALLVILVATLLMLTLGASAGSVTRLRANVPFAFYVGTEQLPAGGYIFEIASLGPAAATSTLVRVLDHDGKTTTLIQTMPGADSHMNDDHLHFNRYGEMYFLSKVEALGYQANLRATRSEKEAMAQSNQDRGTTILALK
jgi:hypothetical protein